MSATTTVHVRVVTISAGEPCVDWFEVQAVTLEDAIEIVKKQLATPDPRYVDSVAIHAQYDEPKEQW